MRLYGIELVASQDNVSQRYDLAADLRWSSSRTLPVSAAEVGEKKKKKKSGCGNNEFVSAFLFVGCVKIKPSKKPATSAL